MIAPVVAVPLIGLATWAAWRLAAASSVPGVDRWIVVTLLLLAQGAIVVALAGRAIDLAPDTLVVGSVAVALALGAVGRWAAPPGPAARRVDLVAGVLAGALVVGAVAGAAQLAAHPGPSVATVSAARRGTEIGAVAERADTWLQQGRLPPTRVLGSAGVWSTGATATWAAALGGAPGVWLAAAAWVGAAGLALVHRRRRAQPGGGAVVVTVLVLVLLGDGLVIGGLAAVLAVTILAVGSALAGDAHARAARPAWRATRVADPHDATFVPAIVSGGPAPIPRRAAPRRDRLAADLVAALLVLVAAGAGWPALLAVPSALWWSRRRAALGVGLEAGSVEGADVPEVVHGVVEEVAAQ